MKDWNSSLYLKFKKERTQPSVDLVKRIDIVNPKKIIDIGCGPGNSTKVLADRFPNAEILGVDYSDDMLKKAKLNHPDIDFKKFDACEKSWDLDTDYDIVFSNACIQWIPDHRELLPKMMGLLKDGGVMAVQIPLQRSQPVHHIVKSVAKSAKWSGKFDFERPFYILDEGEYFDILSEISKDFTMWQTTYYHRLCSHQDIVEWYKSTGMKPYLDVLDDQDKNEFISDIYSELIKEYKVQQNGEIIFKFPRLFFIAKK